MEENIKDSTSLEIVSREEWGAKPLCSSKKLRKHPLRFVLLARMSRSEECGELQECCRAMQFLQYTDIVKGFKDIRYNFYLGSDGRAYEGRGWWVRPVRKSPYIIRYGEYIHVAFIGDFRKKKRPDLMYRAQRDFFDLAVEKGLLKKDFKFI